LNITPHQFPENNIRVGVFVCHCGSNIGGVVNVPEVVEYARTLPNVAYAEDNLYSCSEEGLHSLKHSIHEHNLNRVVVASCTPRTHEPLFRNACEKAGLNRYLFEFVNIREHCSWIHPQGGDPVTDKAKRLVRMGVVKSILLQPQSEIESGVVPGVLVIGGGIAGITAALNLARQGFQVHLVEKESQIGGRLVHINRLFPTDNNSDKLIDPLIQQIENHKLITLHMPAKVNGVSGYVGSFQVTITGDNGEQKIEVGMVIVATGADVLRPSGLFGYGTYPNVLTQLELEARLKVEPIKAEKVVFINCVGARIHERPYCSRVCCLTALKNAIQIKEQNPKSQVCILHRDILAYGVEYEKYYHRAMEMGIRFVNYKLEHPPQVVGDTNAEKIVVLDALRGRELRLPVELVVLTTPLIAGQDNAAISRLLKAPLGESGFFLEAHVKLRPVEFATDGIFVCGTARWPADVSESIAQGYAAASKAAIPMRAGVVTAEAITAFSDTTRCEGCNTCVHTCPYNAIELQTLNDDKQVAQVNLVQCKGCGCCVAACPNGAMQQRGYTDQQVLQMISVVSSLDSV